MSKAGEWKLEKEKVRAHEQNVEQVPPWVPGAEQEGQPLFPVLCWEPWEGES